MTEPQTADQATQDDRPTIRKAPDADRHPALAVQPTSAQPEESAQASPEPAATSAEPKKPWFKRIFSRTK